MIDGPFDIARLPLLMTTSEVCAVARISKRTLARRMHAGTIDLQKCDTGRENIFHRSDVVRAFRLGGDQGQTQQASTGWDRHEHTDPATFHAALKAARHGKPSRKPFAPEPSTPDHQRARALSAHPWIRVSARDDGRYDVVFVASSTVRATTWPSTIILPRVSPGPVALTTQQEFDDLAKEAVAIRAECRAALLAEKAQEGRNPGR